MLHSKRRDDGTGARVLVSGASFAGLATAYWMHRLGFGVTIVELAPGFRRGGTPVDIKEGTIGIVRRMGLLDAIRARSLPPRSMTFKSRDGITQAELPARPVVADDPHEEYEIERDALLDILSGALAPGVDIAFGRTIRGLREHADGIMATFDDGSDQTFALVFGCDGMRSNTRRLVFGADDPYCTFLGCYTYLKVVPKEFIAPNTTQIHSTPGRTVMLNGYHGRTDIGFGYRSVREIPYDHRDKAEQKRLVRHWFGHEGWLVPDLLREVDDEGDFYFDKLCQVRMPAWTKGRVALVGDAGYCPSPAAGMGGSMALVGAAALYDAFERHPTDIAAAFQAYDTGLRPTVEAIQDEAVNVGLPLFLPGSEADIAARDHMLAGMMAA